MSNNIRHLQLHDCRTSEKNNKLKCYSDTSLTDTGKPQTTGANPFRPWRRQTDRASRTNFVRGTGGRASSIQSVASLEVNLSMSLSVTIHRLPTTAGLWGKHWRFVNCVNLIGMMIIVIIVQMPKPEPGNFVKCQVLLHNCIIHV